MAIAHLRREERIGLGIALALHLALAAALLLQPAQRKAIPPPERMTVNLTTEVGLDSAAPEPVSESAAPAAPTLAPEPAPPAPTPRPAPEPVPQPAAARPAPAPRPVATSAPLPQPAPRVLPSPRVRPTASTEPRRRPDAPAGQARTSPAAQPAARPAARPVPKSGGASRIGADFLPGAGASTTTRETRVPASQIGASAKASLVQAIARELKPKWQPPSGPEVDRITTYLRFRLNPDGSLAGRPEVVRQTGVTDTNRPQASRHAEQAIRAVQLAAPFDLPDEYYEAWKLVGPFGFDWKLAQ